MKKSVTTLLVTLSVMLFAGSLFASSVQSLRGSNALAADAEKPNKQKVVSQKGGFKRSYKQQPPMVPHKVDKYRISLKNNGCMKCHSEKTYKREKAPKAGDSHYVTRDGKTLKKVSARRYFCNQCHATQMNGTPLVQNNFQGAK